MARTVLEVVVAGDSKSLERAMGRSSKSVDRFGKDTDKSLKKASKGFAGISSAAKLAGGAIAGAGLLAGLKGVASAAAESEKSTAKLRAQLTASGLSYKKYAGEIETVIQKQSKLAAVDDEDLQDAFTNIVRVTGNVSQSLKLSGLAADISRAKNIDLAKAGELVGKVAGGNTGILSRYGIQIEKGATATEALGVMQQKFGGQAEAYGKTSAGAQDRFRVAVENLQEKLGAKLLPTLATVANGAARFVTQMEDGTGAGGKFAAAVGSVVSAVGGLIGTIKNAVKGFRDGDAAMVALGITMTGLVAGFVAFKVITTVIAAMTALKAAVIGVNIAMRANPFVAVATVVAALGVALVVAYKKSETFRRVVDGVFTAVKKVVGDAISFILRAFDKYLGGLSSIASAAAKLPLVGDKFKGVAAQIDVGREKLRKMADGLDAIGEKKIKPRIDTSEIDAAIKRAGGLKGALKDSAVSLTATPRKDAGDLPAGSNAGGLLGGLSAGARGVYGNVSRLFGGVRLTSGLRSPSQNAAVGGAKNSDHLTGNALDLVPAEGWNAQSISRFDRIAAWARSRGLWVGWRGIPNHGPGNHLHLSYRGRQTAQGQRMGDPAGKYMSTAYGPPWNAMNGTGVTRNGTDLRPAKRAYGIAVDPTKIRLGSSVYAWPNPFNRRGPFKAFDTGGAIKGKRIDFYDWRGRSAQNRWGRRSVTVGASASAVFGGKKAAAGRKTVMTSKMGASSVVPLNDVEQAKADTLAEMKGYAPSGSLDAGGGDLGGGDFGSLDSGPSARELELEVLIEELRRNTEAQLAQAAALNALKDQSIAESKQRERTAQSQYGVLANAIADVTNGNLGGRVGLGFQSVGFAGGGVRY